MENITYSELLKIADALESGKYKKSYTTLRNKTGYCVEGVACEVVLGNNWNFVENKENGFAYYDFINGENVYSLFAPKFIGKPLADSLSVLYAHVLNDTSLMSFNEMAEMIREFVNTRIKYGSKLTEPVS